VQSAPLPEAATGLRLLQTDGIRQRRTLRLVRALFEAGNRALPKETLNLVIDHTLVPRQSEKTPGSIIRHDHARKDNWPHFLMAQCWSHWASACWTVRTGSMCCRLRPVLSSATGNLNKLTIALALVHSLTPVMMNKRVRLLFAAWFMRARLILPLLSRKIPIIGNYGAIPYRSCHQARQPSLDTVVPEFTRAE